MLCSSQCCAHPNVVLIPTLSQDFVKAVAYNLFAFMQSFGAVQALGGDKLLDQWFQVS